MLKKITLTLLLSLTMTAKQLAPATPDWLDAWYRGYNVVYFTNELPQTVMISHNLKDDRFMAVTSYDFNGNFYQIEFNIKYGPSPKQEKMTLLHEQCHLEQLVTGQMEFEDHGKKWQACMHRLANEGAFENLW